MRMEVDTHARTRIHTSTCASATHTWGTSVAADNRLGWRWRNAHFVFDGDNDAPFQSESPRQLREENKLFPTRNNLHKTKVQKSDVRIPQDKGFTSVVISTKRP